MVTTMLLETSTWVVVPHNVHSIHETRSLCISLSVIFLGHIKSLQWFKMVSGCAASWRFRPSILGSTCLDHLRHCLTQSVFLMYFWNETRRSWLLAWGTLHKPRKHYPMKTPASPVSLERRASCCNLDHCHHHLEAGSVSTQWSTTVVSLPLPHIPSFDVSLSTLWKTRFSPALRPKLPALSSTCHAFLSLVITNLPSWTSVEPQSPLTLVLSLQYVTPCF